MPRKLPAAVELGRRGGQANTESQRESRSRNGRRAVGRPQRGAPERRALLAGRALPCLVGGYTRDGRHVATWMIATTEDAETFIRYASPAVSYRVVEEG